jgi:hypothetical protein
VSGPREGLRLSDATAIGLKQVRRNHHLEQPAQPDARREEQPERKLQRRIDRAAARIVAQQLKYLIETELQ